MLFRSTQSGDLISPCSSGATYESAMKVINLKANQKMVTSHALASMGFGLTGGIGLSFAYPQSRVIVFEGDGGFSQNLQELSTVRANDLNMKIFIIDNGGYMSIKRNQQRAFDGHYVGCDRNSGLMMPDWKLIASAFQIPYFEVRKESLKSQDFIKLFNTSGPNIFHAKIDPNQFNFPNISSSIDKNGIVTSNPLHKMNPPLSEEHSKIYLPYLSSKV